MQRGFIFLSIVLSTFFTQKVQASNPISIKQFTNNKSWAFIENKGQLSDENNRSIEKIKYYGHQGNVNIYCEPGMLGFVFTKTKNNLKQVSEATGSISAEQLQNAIIEVNRAEMILIGSNKDAQIIAEDRQSYYEN